MKRFSYMAVLGWLMGIFCLMQNSCAARASANQKAVHVVMATDTIPVKPVKLPKGYTARINTIYATHGAWQGRMDLYIPGAPMQKGSPMAGTAPVLINIHGGAWTHGNKESQGGFSTFLKKGFLVANVEYRMSPIAKAPAAIQDVRCALLYLVQHATELNIDINKIVVMGASAGGHLALMAGLLGSSNHAFDQNCLRQMPPQTKAAIKSETKTETETKTASPFRIAAIIDKYGPTDLSIVSSLDHIKKSAYSWLGEGVKNPAFLRSISPLYYVDRHSPPVFIVHGDADPTVPYHQSELLHAKLDKAGVYNQFVTVPGGLHGKFTQEQKKQLSQQIIAFLEQCKVIAR